MIEFYYIKVILENPRRNQIILDQKGRIKRFTSQDSAQRWLNKNKDALTPGAIYTPTPGLTK